jgi:hypothetical protein
MWAGFCTRGDRVWWNRVYGPVLDCCASRGLAFGVLLGDSCGGRRGRGASAGSFRDGFGIRFPNLARSPASSVPGRWRVVNPWEATARTARWNRGGKKA